MRDYRNCPGYPKLPSYAALVAWCEEYDAAHPVKLEELDPPQQKRVEYDSTGYGQIVEVVTYED